MTSIPFGDCCARVSSLILSNENFSRIAIILLTFNSYSYFTCKDDVNPLWGLLCVYFKCYGKKKEEKEKEEGEGGGGIIIE